MNYAHGSEQLLQEIAEAFPGASDALASSFIEANADPTSLEVGADPQVFVPAYMAWCVRNSGRPQVLVHDHTVRALCEFGRSKNPAIKHLSFKHQCSPRQRAAVVSFLNWCLNPELLHHVEQIERSLKHWAVEPKQ